MNLLLDTHIFLWALSDTDKLSSETIKLIQNEDNIVFVSVVTLWELQIKKSLGKIKLPKLFEENIPQYGYEILNVNLNHVSKLNNLPMIHRDPFDRMLIAQAKAEHLSLVTKDQDVLKYSKVTLIKG
ncbi:unnamed protein product [Ectocarpus sp. 12 AP-2014]